jgi:hypothetical protein
MVNKSKGDIAYTVINLDESAADAAVNEISRIVGVIRVRTFAK